VHYESNELPCKLCNGEGQIEVIPNGGGHNDSQLDECPWCLRRTYEALKDKTIWQTKNKQPKKSGWYLVWCGKKRGSWLQLCYLKSEKKFRNHNSFISNYEYSHEETPYWRKLPEPPFPYRKKRA